MIDLDKLEETVNDVIQETWVCESGDSYSPNSLAKQTLKLIDEFKKLQNEKEDLENKLKIANLCIHCP